VTQYARDVVAGVVIAGRAVRLACQRHLDDVMRQLTPDFPYRFDAARAQDVFKFFREFLTLDDVDANQRPLVFDMLRWLQFVFGSLEGWVDREGHLRFQQAYLETAKGSCKTPTAGGYGLYRLVGQNRTAVENYVLGVNSDQANYLYQFAKRMAERSEDLNDLLDIGEYNLAWVARNSFFRPLTSEGRSLDNKRVYTAIIEELHEHPTPVIPEKMRLGIKGQTDALIIELTNSGSDKATVCWAHHDYSLKVLDRTVIDERWFAYVCQLDPCDACRAKGATQPDDSCTNCDAWTDERVWGKVNPAVLELPQLVEYTRGIVQQAINQPSMLARVKRLNFCIWTQTHTIWIPNDKWDACRVDPTVVGQQRGVPCAAMFDMSMKSDLTACVIAQRIDDPPETAAVQVELVDNDQGAAVKKVWSINYTIDLTAFFWIPRDTMQARIKNEHVPFDVWERQGFIRPTPGPVIDHHLIYDQFVNEIGATFKPQRVGYDPYNATEFAVGLRDRAKYTVVEIGQGRKLSEFIKLFEALVLLRRIRHAGNFVFGWCVSNAEPKYDRYENVWLEKSSPTKRIDGAIAAIGAVSQVIVLPAPRGKGRKTRVWTAHGFVPAIPASEPSGDQPAQ
jgi:phage terminase large subunit-like protein